MAQNKNLQKLELTWIGKGEEPKLEPRILIENPEYSYGDPNTENMLIHGDNLLALKALEQDYAGKIKCIYIDPPYNTGAAFEQYDDNVEHSIWLNLMYKRLLILKNLLSNDGFIFINIDDNELAYLRVICDEIFGRDNSFDQIAVKTSSSQGGFGGVNPGLVSNTEYILIYCKNKSLAKFNEDKLFVEKQYDENYKYYIHNLDDNIDTWQVTTLNELAYKELGIPEPYNNSTWRILKDKYGEFWELIRYNVKSKIALNNPNKVFRTFNPNKPAKYLQDALTISKHQGNRNTFIEAKSSSDDIKLCFNGEVVLFYNKMMKLIDNKMVPVKFLTTFWEDFSWEGIASEGGVKLRNGKKPEALLKRIFEISTNPGDLVLDSFLGSGTTAAVAHKMGRKYIGIELGEHAITHCYPRLKQVVDGEQGGISKSVNWQGGGGFSFYSLHPEPVFLPNGQIRADIKFTPLAAFLWQYETGLGAIQALDKPYLGEYNGTAYYLLYNGILGDRRPNSGNVLTRQLLSWLLETYPHDGPKVIYGESSRIGAERLALAGVTFKQIPYDILQR